MILAIAWTFIIFSFSLQPAEVSDEMSSGFGRKLIEIFAPWLEGMLETMPEEQLSFLHFLLRKCAHFTEFFILGVLVWLSRPCVKARRNFIYCVMICLLVASVDETIQLFVSGRAGKMWDVFLDTSGATIGSFITKKLYK